MSTRMRTMPRITLKTMRFLVEFMLTRIQAWEDRHASVDDYRMGHLTTGLWQASQSMKEILAGEFIAGYRNGGSRAVGKAWRTDQPLGEHFETELLGRVPGQQRPVD